MDAHVKAIVRECTAGSDEGRVTFPEVVRKLMEVGVERYHADLIRSEKTYYTPDGDSEIVAAVAVALRPAAAFSSSSVDAAVRAIQARAITYKEFCERIAEAGCVGYFVSLPGRRAVYYGRTAENHVEHFPGAK